MCLFAGAETGQEEEKKVEVLFFHWHVVGMSLTSQGSGEKNQARLCFKLKVCLKDACGVLDPCWQTR